MAMVIKNNSSATNTLNTLNRNSSALSKSLEKVSSGMRINSAGDDASGYAISERMRVQTRALDQDLKNTQNGNSMMKVAEGAVSSTVEILKTLKEKVINAANDTNSDADRATIQKELDQSIDQIDDNANITYNGKYLVDGSHNRKVTATYTHLSNEMLHEDTATDDLFTDLRDARGESLYIESTDTLTVSYVKQGTTHVTSFSVGEHLLRDLFGVGNEDIQINSVPSSAIGLDASGNTVYTSDGNPAVTLQAKTPGTDGQISGITICFTDKHGQLRTSANSVLDSFTETIRAENESKDNAIVLQTGTKANQAIKVAFTDMRSVALGLKGTDGTKLNIATQEKANAAINVLENALQKCLDQQTTIGSVESRLNFTASNLTTASENVQQSESTIRDADMAKEMTEYTKNNVLLQAAQSMLAQANQSSSAVLSLLQ